jgi:hypothetical protein
LGARLRALLIEQHSRIAAAYEKAASDYMVPPQHREAFARKADWFRMLARLGGKQKSVGTPLNKQSQPAGENPHTPDNNLPRMLSAARHLFAWQQRR